MDHDLRVQSMSSLCPLEYRYGSAEMRRLFAREEMLRRMILVEAALMKGLEKAGLAPRDCWRSILDCGRSIRPEDIDRAEEKTGHDVGALTMLLAEKCGKCGGYVHLGATSNDIIDTAWSLVLRDALRIIEEKLVDLMRTLMGMSEKYMDLIMVGRTHGQHALPITLGFKLAVYVYEYARSLERLMSLEDRLIRGKMSGAVGTMAAWGDKGFEVEAEAMRMLSLKPHVISTQVAPRDGFAELIAAAAILASQLERMAIEVRELSRPEIGELSEKPRGTMGSSTMPHKSNPVLSERVTSLARLIRSFLTASLENIALWHERDLSNSANERIIIPHTLVVLDEMLESSRRILGGLRVYPEAMQRNLNLTKGLILSEALMIKLVEKGVPRHQAYKHVQAIAGKASERKIEFLEACLNDPLVSGTLTRSEIEGILRAENYLGMYEKLAKRAISYANLTLKQYERKHSLDS